MENNFYLEERFKLALELNYTLEELAKVDRQLKFLKYDNTRLILDNIDNKKKLPNIKKPWNEIKSENELLLKKSQEIDDNINALKKQLNGNFED